MGTFRMYTGSDGQTHIETIDLAKTPSWTEGLDASKITFRSAPAGRFQDWHPAPRRQIIVTLGGWGEMEAGDGQKVRCTPGVLALVEDVAGVGHQTWTDPEEGWHMLFIPLDESTTLV